MQQRPGRRGEGKEEGGEEEEEGEVVAAEKNRASSLLEAGFRRTPFRRPPSFLVLFSEKTTAGNMREKGGWG